MTQQVEDEPNANLPLGRLFKIVNSDIVLDLMLEGYSISFSKDEIVEITSLPANDVDAILENLEAEGIIKKTKVGFDVEYRANFSSPRTAGLFEYVRATLDKNLEDRLQDQSGQLQKGLS